jgi:hypothetical protein
MVAILLYSVGESENTNTGELFVGEKHQQRPTNKSFEVQP